MTFAAAIATVLHMTQTLSQASRLALQPEEDRQAAAEVIGRVVGQALTFAAVFEEWQQEVWQFHDDIAQGLVR